MDALASAYGVINAVSLYSSADRNLSPFTPSLPNG